MAGKITKDQRVAIAGASAAGVITVASTSGMYARMRGHIAKGGQPGMKIYVIQILGATTLQVREDVESRGQGAIPGPIVASTHYGVSDVSAYNGGWLVLPGQVVYNPNDAPLT